VNTENGKTENGGEEVMITYRKVMFRGMMAAGLLLSIGSVGFAQTDANASSIKSLKVVSGVGALTVAPATSCVNIICPTGDVCDFVTITGTSKNFNRFGGFKGDSSLLLCESTDTTLAIPNGNDTTTCSPSSGIGVLTSGSNTISFNIAGQTCTVPGTLASGIEVFNQTFAITGSTAKNVSTGGGSFNAWSNGTSGTFNFAGNYSK
jgi:hypothetical protein